MRTINVIHLCYSDNYGGSGRAVQRINSAINLHTTIRSKIATVESSKNLNTICLSPSILDKIWLYVRVRLAYKSVAILQKSKNSSGRSINFFPSNVLKNLENLEFDILHLHWIGNETIRIEDLKKINKPIVWTFHDKWPFLGAEHTEIKPTKRYIDGYSSINKQLTNSRLDIDRWVFNRKLKTFRSLNIFPVAVSNGLTEEIKKSLIWKNSNPIVIHNPLDISNWQILNKSKSRLKFGISDKSKVLVFGAVNAFQDELKGYKLLEKALELLEVSEDIVLVIFGNKNESKSFKIGKVNVKPFGVVKNIKFLNELYSIADTTVVPSYFESFGQIAVESMACGTPVVSFKTSGLKDIIEDKVNGLFASPFDHLDLKDKIMQALSMSWKPNHIREGVRNKFDHKQIAKKYEDVYLKMHQ